MIARNLATEPHARHSPSGQDVLLGDRYLVEWFTAFVELDEREEDGLVHVCVKIDGLQDLDNGSHHFAVDENRSDHGHLGFEITRRNPIGAPTDAGSRNRRH